MPNLLFSINKVSIYIILIFNLLIITPIIYARSNNYLNHIDKSTYDNTYYIYTNDNDRFDAIYNDFVTIYKYQKLDNLSKMRRLLQLTVIYTDKYKQGECYELSTALVSKLSYYNIPARVVVGRNINHTWIEVMIDDNWVTYDPTDDIYNYNNNQIWGYNRNYEHYKILMYR